MIETCAIFGVLGVLLAIVTVVGHGLWLLVAKILRSITSPGERSSQGPPQRYSPQVHIDEATIAARHVQRLYADGRIDAPTLEHVMRAMGRMEPAPWEIFHDKPESAPRQTLESAPTPPLPGVQRIPSPVPAMPTGPARRTPPPLPVFAPPVPPPKPIEPATPPEPRRSLGEVFASFMEESNIRWGELVGGLLTLGCSIALVITFWAQIAAHPWLKFFLFTGVTAAVFGVGLYTEHRWKLPNTSRGTLLVATLLVPLNFLAIVAFSRDQGSLLIRLAAELLALALFAWLVHAAGKVLVRRQALLLAFGVLATSLTQIAIARFGTQASTWRVLALALLPIATYCAASFAMLRGTHSKAGEDDTSAVVDRLRILFTLFGVFSFAALLPLGLLAQQLGWWWTAERISPLLPAAAIPALATGLILWQRLTDPALARWRTAATSIGVGGALVLLASLALAWPNPSTMLPVALVDAIILASIAIFCAIPAALLPASACAVFAGIIAFHLFGGRIGWSATTDQLLAVLDSPPTAIALFGAVVILGAIAEAFHRTSRLQDSRFVRIAAAAAAVVSIGLGTRHGLFLSNDHGLTWLYVAYATLAMAAAVRFRKAIWTWSASALLAAALVQRFGFRYAEHPGTPSSLALAMLIHATIACGIVAALPRLKRARWRSPLRQPLLSGAVVSSAIAAGLVLLSTGAAPNQLALRTTWLAALWGVLALTTGSALLFGLFQGALYVAAALGARAIVFDRPWYQSPQSWTDPWTWQAYALALALVTCAWSIVRAAFAQSERLSSSLRPLRRLLEPRALHVDEIGLVVSLLAAVVLSALAAIPGIAAELAPIFAPLALNETQITLHAHARDFGAWTLLAAVALALAVRLWERFDAWRVLALLVMAGCSALLLAAGFEPANASASALRWAACGVLIFLSMLIWLRAWLNPFASRLRWPGYDHAPIIWTNVRTLLLAMTVPAILGPALYAAYATLTGNPIAGPAHESYFQQIGSTTSYLVPLLLTVAVFVAHAAIERSNAFALAGGLLLNLTAALAYALHLSNRAAPIISADYVRLVQLVAISAAGYAIAWIIIQGRRRRDPSLLAGLSTPLAVELAVAALALACALIPTEFQLIANPARHVATLAAASDALAWLGWGLFAIACLLVLRRTGKFFGIAPFAIALLALGSLLGLRAAVATDQWTGYHVLLATRAAAAWLLLGFGLARSRGSVREQQQEGSSITGWAVFFGIFTLVLSWRALHHDPASPTWTLAGILATSLLCVALVVWSARPAWWYGAGLLLNAAATIWWLSRGQRWSLVAPIELIAINIIAIALSGLACLLLELLVLRSLRQAVVHRGILPYHHFAALLSTVGAVVLAGLSLAGAALGITRLPAEMLVWSAVATSSLLMFTSLWDTGARFAIKGLYLAGLAVAAATLAQLDPILNVPLRFSLTMAIAAYALLVAFLYTMRISLAIAAERAGIPMRPTWPSQRPAWVAAVTLIKTLLVLAISLQLVTDLDQRLLRLAASVGAVAASVAVALLAHRQKRTRLFSLTLVLAALSAALWGWAWLDPRSPATALFLNRLVILLVTAAAATVVYAVLLAKLLHVESPWTSAAKHLSAFTGAATVALLLLTLAMEAMYFRAPDTSITIFGIDMAPWAMLAVGLSLIGLAVAALVCAIVPGRDPFDLSERGRTLYVYGAEFLLALLFLHVKLCVPDILQIGIWRRYWPVIIVLIAFFGVGLSELFRRQRRLVLAEPLERTGAFLPILPAIAYFMISGHHLDHVDYQHVLFLGALLYGVLAYLRKSFVFGLLSALSANGGLWWLLHHTHGLGLLEHPQLWLIPAAVSVLVAAYLNRDRLAEEQMRAIRYITLSVIYASSTADILLNGVRHEPYLPLVLAGLAVAGVIAGIALRVQSFLFLGTVFLLVAIAAMIQYASLQLGASWPWLAAGVIVGAAIVFTFALFEKKREEMLAMVHGLREWQH